MRGPKNVHAKDLLEQAARARLEQLRLPPMPPIREWRTPPDGREYARRYQVWELLAWYHHEYLRHELGLRAWIRRKLRHFFGGQAGRMRNLSPWEQLALKDRWEAEDWAERAALEKREEEQEAAS